MNGKVVWLMSVAFTACASLSHAQTTSDAPLSFRGIGSLGRVSMGASESFDAVAGSSALGQFGGGVQVLNVWRSLFVEVLFERSSVDGERVFVLDDEVFPLGIPLDVRVSPIDITAGWRLRNRGRFTPYAGGGLTSIGYRESSPFGRDDEEVSERGSGLVTFGGVEVPVWRWIRVRGELRFRHVSGVLGDGGVSSAFDESSVGGLTYGVKLAIGK